MHPGLKLRYAGEIYSETERLKKAVDGMRDCTPDWYSILLIELSTECIGNGLELIRGIDEANLSRCAWAARNLLELTYFTRFVAQSLDDARRFHEDAVCDLKDLLNKLEAANSLPEIVAQGNMQLDQYMARMERITEEDRYLKVSTLARTFGEEDLYNIANKYLSKFVHPTSISIQAKKDSKLVEMAIAGIVQQSLFFIRRAFPPLLGCLANLSPKPAL